MCIGRCGTMKIDLSAVRYTFVRGGGNVDRVIESCKILQSWENDTKSVRNHAICVSQMGENRSQYPNFIRECCIKCIKKRIRKIIERGFLRKMD